jgi:hypothetical protein
VRTQQRKNIRTSNIRTQTTALRAKNRRGGSHIREVHSKNGANSFIYTRKRKDINHSRIPATAETPTTA